MVTDRRIEVVEEIVEEIVEEAVEGEATLNSEGKVHNGSFLEGNRVVVHSSMISKTSC
jgi:hypothetical protein